MLVDDRLFDCFHVDSGTSTHLIRSRNDLKGYVDFAQPLKIAGADSGKTYAYGSGTCE